jgi:DNA-binding NtrC family response regulator
MPDIKVLLVDDERELVTTLVERLGFRGIAADYATSGAEALEKIRHGGFTVVVLDVKMPGMSGLDVLSAIKRDYPLLPVLLITGHGSPTDESKIPVDAFDCLPKPISLDLLLHKIREAVAGR